LKVLVFFLFEINEQIKKEVFFLNNHVMNDENGQSLSLNRIQINEINIVMMMMMMMR
jgi:hypothetical protein